MNNKFLGVSILLSVGMLAFAWVYVTGLNVKAQSLDNKTQSNTESVPVKSTPSCGI